MTGLIDLAGWLAAALTLAAYSMRTMLPLRSTAIGANLCFILYGGATGVYPMLALHLCLLPLNAMRLGQILRDRRRAATGTGTDALRLLRSVMREVTVPAGTRLFGKGDAADRVYLIEEGEVLVEEPGLTYGPGALVGEMAFFNAAGQRTASVRCTRDCRLLAADGGSFIDAYYRDPSLALHVTRLIANRLCAPAGDALEART